MDTSLLTAGDLNHDGIIDLVGANNGGTLTVLIGVGPGDFVAAKAFTGAGSKFMTAADLSNDSDPDFVTDSFRIQFGASGANFKNPVSYSTSLFFGSGTVDDAIPTDFDGDGDSDVVLQHGNSGPYKLSLWENNGNGSFPAKPPDYFLGINDSLKYVAVGDLNNDGHADTVTTAQNKVYLFFGDGTGKLVGPTSYSAGGTAMDVVVDYINADPFLDIIVANPAAVTVLLGIGGGVFAAPVSYAAGSGPTNLRAGDFDNDGDADLAVANPSSNNVAVLLGNGDGTFAPPLASPPVGANPPNLVLEDFDGDGKLDVATSNLNSHSISILLGHGDGTFEPAVNFASSANPKDIDVGDLDADGKQDLVVISGLEAAIDIFRGNGDGTFGLSVTLAAPSDGHNVSVADLTGDGMLDMAAAFPGASVGFFRGNGDGTFAWYVPYVGGSSPVDLAVADFDSDGINDLAVANILQSSLRIVPGATNGLDALKLVAIAGANVTRFGDFNGDGLDDFVAAASDGLRVRLNQGDGTFPPFEFYPLAGVGTMILGDFNADGTLDIVIEQNSDVSLMMGNGDGTFAAPVVFIFGTNPDKLLVGDFNNDAQPDVAAANLASATITVALGNGDGTFVLTTGSVVPSKKDIVAGDVNGDGVLDQVALTKSTAGFIHVMLGNGDGSFEPSMAFAVSYNPRALLVGDYDQDGWLDAAIHDGNWIIILKNDGIWPPLPITQGPRRYAPLEVAENQGTNHEPSLRAVTHFNGVGIIVNAADGPPLPIGAGPGTFAPLNVGNVRRMERSSQGQAMTPPRETEIALPSRTKHTARRIVRGAVTETTDPDSEWLGLD